MEMDYIINCLLGFYVLYGSNNWSFKKVNNYIIILIAKVRVNSC